MIRHQLLIIGYKSSIYIAMFVFFLACILGYASNLAVDTLIQKAVIAGCLTGLIFFVLVKMLVKNVPEDIDIVGNNDGNDKNESGK